jgi:hypothetical protein
MGPTNHREPTIELSEAAQRKLNGSRDVWGRGVAFRLEGDIGVAQPPGCDRGRELPARRR